MKHYMIHCASISFYACDEYATNKRQAIKQFRKRWGLNKMPSGFSIWAV